MGPADVEAEVDAMGAAGRQLRGEAGEEGVERDLARREEDVAVVSLRDALARPGSGSGSRS
jgi:hypothetical protein